MSGFRGSVKKIAGSKVEGFYHLVEGPECHAKVEKLIQASTYIYPVKEVSLPFFFYMILVIMYNQGRGLIIRSKPFNNPAVILILSEVFFGSTQKSLAEQYHDCFASTIEMLSDEAEIPAAALALVATCVCFITTLDYDSDNSLVCFRFIRLLMIIHLVFAKD